MLTGNTSKGIPEGSRATQGKSLRPEFLNDPPSPTSASSTRSPTPRPDPRPDGDRLGAPRRRHHLRPDWRPRPSQVDDCVGAVKNLAFTAEELAEIDCYANEEDINLWASSSEAR